MHLPARLILNSIAAFACFVSCAFAQSTSDTPPADGQQLYIANCSACHQTSGMGLPNMAPALMGNPIVAGDPSQLIQIVLKGPAAVLPANRPHYGSNTMDSFYYKLSDDQVAAILTYVRHQFGKIDKSPAIVTQDVFAIRAKIDPQTLNN